MSCDAIDSANSQFGSRLPYRPDRLIKRIIAGAGLSHPIYIIWQHNSVAPDITHGHSAQRQHPPAVYRFARV